jgi:hypothetical protein
MVVRPLASTFDTPEPAKTTNADTNRTPSEKRAQISNHGEAYRHADAVTTDRIRNPPLDDCV